VAGKKLRDPSLIRAIVECLRDESSIKRHSDVLLTLFWWWALTHPSVGTVPIHIVQHGSIITAVLNK